MHDVHEHQKPDERAASYLSDYERLTTNRLRWTGRLMGFVFGGFLGMMGIGEIVEGLRAGSFDSEGIAPVSLALIAALGALLSFHWERAGGVLLLVAGFGFGAVILLMGGLGDLWVALILGIPLAVSGSFSLICWARSRGA